MKKKYLSCFVFDDKQILRCKKNEYPLKFDWGTGYVKYPVLINGSWMECYVEQNGYTIANHFKKYSSEDDAQIICEQYNKNLLHLSDEEIECIIISSMFNTWI